MRNRCRIGSLDLEVIGHPEYAVAHPDEGCDDGDCDKCLLAIRPDTGEIVLLWGAYCFGEPRHYGLSRETPDYQRHADELYGQRAMRLPSRDIVYPEKTSCQAA